MDGVDHSDQVLYRGLGVNGMAQIEDMPGPSARLFPDIRNALPNLHRRREEHGRMQVPLDSRIVPNARPKEGSATPFWLYLRYAVLVRGLTDGILSAVRGSTADSGTITTVMLSPTALKTSRA